MIMRRLAVLLILLATFLLVLVACNRALLPGPSENVYVYPTFTPMPLPAYNQEAASAAAQATLASGQSQLSELSSQATLVNQNINQAANAAAQSTIDYNGRQLMELSIQGTEVSQNMARAAATQEFIAQQTQMAGNTTATAQSQVATAIYFTYNLNATQTARAQGVLDVQNDRTALANAIQKSDSLTATPLAGIQADIVQSRNESERRSWWEDFVTTPLTVVLVTLMILLLIAGGIIAYMRLMPILELRLRTISRENDLPLLMRDGTVVDANLVQRELTQRESSLLEQSLYSSDEIPLVEIIGPDEPSITNWITEAEEKLRSQGRGQP